MCPSPFPIHRHLDTGAHWLIFVAGSRQVADDQRGRRVIVEEDTEKKLEEPPMYRVLLHNDDFTTMEFVVEVLQRVFNKALSEATKIMLSVHNRGSGVCGVYPAQIAETKVDAVHQLARQNDFPLRCSIEET